jgi:uncharacterized protein YwqG
MSVSVDQLKDLALSSLPLDAAQRWGAMVRPGVRLRTDAADQAVIATLGGRPHLPAAMPWPQWQGKGPLSFVGEVDCTAASTFAPWLGLPPNGHLLCFYFDGQYDNGAATVGYWDPETAAGAQILYVPDHTERVEAHQPDNIEPFPVVVLGCEVIGTPPSWENPALGDVWEQAREPFLQFYGQLYELDDADGVPRHQLGGHPSSLQGPVELEVAMATLHRETGEKPKWTDDVVQRDAAAGWSLVVQVDTDDAANMMWGDVGMLYYLARPADLADVRFDRAAFTWQCY